MLPNETCSDAPQLSLELSPNLRPDSVRIGVDVFMDCNVRSNPLISPNDLNWFHNGESLRENASAGIRMSGQSLILSHIKLEQRGFYQCQSQNTIGQAFSNRVELRPKFQPICDKSRTKPQVEAKLNKLIKVDCFVEADPNDDIHFEWKFNKTFPSESGISHRLVDIKHFETNSTQSHIMFEPKTNRDFGQLLCLASNSLDRQIEPCVINIIPSAAPDPVFNCFSDSITRNSLSVHCQPPVEINPGPSNGRLSYLVEFYPEEIQPDLSKSQQSDPTRSKQTTTHLRQRDHNEDSIALDKEIRQLTSEQPYFRLDNLMPDTRYKILVYAQNSKGRSEPVYHQASTLSEAMIDQRGKIQLANIKAGIQSSLSERLISYLRVGDYVDLGPHSKQVIEVSLIVLLCTISFALLTFLVTQVCVRSSPGANRSRRKKSGKRVYAAQGDNESKLPLYDRRQAKPETDVQLRTTNQCNMKGLAGSGSDTSRETNTESTLISSRTNGTNTTELYTPVNGGRSSGCSGQGGTSMRRNSALACQARSGVHPSPVPISQRAIEVHRDLYSSLGHQMSVGNRASSPDKLDTPQISVRSGSDHGNSYEHQDQLSLVCSASENRMPGDQIYLISRQQVDKLNRPAYLQQPIEVINPPAPFWSHPGNQSLTASSFRLNDARPSEHSATCRLYNAEMDSLAGEVRSDGHPPLSYLPNSFSIPVSLGEYQFLRRTSSREEFQELNSGSFYGNQCESVNVLRPPEVSDNIESIDTVCRLPRVEHQLTIDSKDQIDRSSIDSSSCHIQGQSEGIGSKRLHVKFDT